jgi:outer membrane protein assembly factor BamA
LGRDHQYNTYRGHLAGFYPVPILGILAGRVEYRVTSTFVPVYEQEYLGGAGNLRGIEFGTLRGDHSYLATTEVRKPLFLLPLREGRSVGLGLHAFYDWGKAWRHGDGFDSGDLRHAWGLGAHVNINAANLRFEWARSDEGDDVFMFEDRFTF